MSSETSSLKCENGVVKVPSRAGVWDHWLTLRLFASR